MKSVLMVDDDNTTLLGIERALSPGDNWQPQTNSS
jgi:hypothetical protein